MEEGVMRLTELPEECMAHVLWLTSPKDACRSAAVSSAFRSAVQSDTLWELFLPHDYRHIISRSVCADDDVTFSSKKELYFRLCDSPIFLDDANLSFSLEKWSGKKCWMLGARLLGITWGDTPDYWDWNDSYPQSRFSQVAELKIVWWLEIKALIETKILSPRTKYAAYLVYQLPEESHWGFQELPITVRVSYGGSTDDVLTEHDVLLVDPPEDAPTQARSRGDGWMEIELGEIFNLEDDATVEFRLRETESGVPKYGLIVEGIELRPKPLL